MLVENENLRNEINIANSFIKILSKSSDEIISPYDTLTNIYRSTSVLAVLDNQIKNAQKQNLQVIVAIIDIDSLRLFITCMFFLLVMNMSYARLAPYSWSLK